MADEPLGIDLSPDPVIEAYKKDVDRTLIRENLKKTPEERSLYMLQMQKFALEVRRAGADSRKNTA
jgi:hypothetical protein